MSEQLKDVVLNKKIPVFDEYHNIDLRNEQSQDKIFASVGGGSVAEGINTTIGSKCFYILSGDIQQHTITLTSLLSEYPQVTSYINNPICYRIASNHNMKSTVVGVSEDNEHRIVLSVDTWPLNDNNQPIFYNGERFQLNEDGTMTGSWTGNILYSHPYDDEEYFSEKTCKYHWLFCPSARDVGCDLTLNCKANHVEGGYSACFADYSHAEGYDCQAIGRFAHTEGLYCKSGYAAHAEGRECQALGDHSHAAGFRSKGLHNESWVWSGTMQEAGQYYLDHGTGTFNVNPNNGLSGFYIGQENLSSILSSLIQPLIQRIEALENSNQ